MLTITKLKGEPVEDQLVEIVERKGKGHPDYLADSLAENFSRELCKFYLRHFGRIMHHNVDKLEVVAGRSEPKFGGGKILQKILVFFSGRATTSIDNLHIELEKIATSSAKAFISKNFRFLDPEEHVRYVVETKGGAGNLTDLYRRKGVIGANDTSVGVSYYPLTQTEELIYGVERFINSNKFKEEFPFSGEDVKVMGVRIGKRLELIIACSFIDKFVRSVSDYLRKKAEIVEAIQRFVEQKSELKANISLNAADRPERGIDGCYLTVTGTSAENGDDGAAGRGNRVNGLIPVNRFICIESTAGKNPVNHVGKIYNVLAKLMAKEIYEKSGVKEVYVRLVSKIGQRIDRPLLINVSFIGKIDEKEMRNIVGKVVESKLNLDFLGKIQKIIINGQFELF
ncbi:MAG: methionine adenosyltransferase [Candidatus Parvarchaeota archaeon]|nr:methionine adenosyltransferase [Candidatus Haiyanarchaeum thermophilum]